MQWEIGQLNKRGLWIRNKDLSITNYLWLQQVTNPGNNFKKKPHPNTFKMGSEYFCFVILI